ncbi:MAG: efflux RND transporter periplasmic adaptor subunit [Duncaniella sp.]|nr:efflux RND transporter periplasmic adaptor subunit [Duncaniella sp.]
MKRLLPSAIVSIVALLTWGCGHNNEHEHHSEAEESEMHDGHEHEHEHEGEDAEEGDHDHDSDEIVLSPEDAERFGVGVEAAVVAPFNNVVRTGGDVTASASDVSMISAPTSGRLQLNAGISVGSKIAGGQTIGRISATGVSGGDVNAAAKATLDAAKRELDRVKPLLEDGLVTRKDYYEALSAYEAAKAAYSPAAASGIVKATKGGVINELAATDGQIVTQGETIAIVGGEGSLTLRALLPSSEASFLPQITNAVISLPDGSILDLADAGGKLMSKSAAGASATPGYVPVYFTFNNSGNMITPGNAVEVWLYGAADGSAISVPDEAVTEQMGQHFVYVKVDDHGYRKTPVTLGRGNGRRYEIVSGIAEGDSIVTRGTTFVRLAETKGAVPEGHHHH